MLKVRKTARVLHQVHLWSASIAGCVFLLNGVAAAAIDFSRQQQFDIAPQALPAALVEFSRQAGVQFTAPGMRFDEVRSAGVKGEYAADKALGLLLLDTGFTFRIVDEGTVAITSAAADRGRGAAPGPDKSVPKENQAQPIRGDSKRSFWDRFRLAQIGAAAATAESARVSDSPAPSETGILQEIVVTSQKREESLARVPIAISVLSGDEMDGASVSGVSEALNAVPGVATTRTYSGGGTNIVIRGVGASFPLYTGPSAVAYYLDSVPFGLVKSAIGPDADAYDLERVEVLRGPQGTLYGSSALNGVVRVLTRSPDLSAFDLKGRVSGSGTERGGGNYRIDQAINVPLIADKLAARASVGYQHNSGWIDQPNDRDANDTNIATYRLKLRGQPTDELTLGASAWSSHEHSAGPDLGYNGRQSASLVHQPSSTQYDAFGFEGGYRFSGFTVTSLTSYLDYSNEACWAWTFQGSEFPARSTTRSPRPKSLPRS
jgi:hypothetical protein